MDVRDKLWLWGHPAGSLDGRHGVQGESRITPVEAACYLGTPNLIVVNYGNSGPFPPFDQFALPMRSLKRVVWSIVGDAGQTDAALREEVFKLAARMPNITGLMMDDFFRDPEGGEDGPLGALSRAELRAVRERLRLPERTLDLWVVLYQHMLDWPVQEQLDLCDKVTLWTSKTEALRDLESSFDRLEKLAPRQGKLLGCYMQDYEARQPMPLQLMKRQCEFALDLLRQRRIEGIIFHASCICDLGLDAVEWARGWISEVGGTVIPA
ncbi:MAG TPA: hypothetical protein VM221_01515 [Armatimonadota bacterium]|nr:hypothetical protein [Armatimonadota bacterium]